MKGKNTEYSFTRKFKKQVLKNKYKKGRARTAYAADMLVPLIEAAAQIEADEANKQLVAHLRQLEEEAAKLAGERDSIESRIKISLDRIKKYDDYLDSLYDRLSDEGE